MANLNFDYRRPCYVTDKKAMFHCWSHVGRVSSPPLLVCDFNPIYGGNDGDVTFETYGIVEFEDGTITRVLPEYIRFADGGDFAAIAFLTESSLDMIKNKNQPQN